eukprot:gene8982-biopygen13721
MLWPIVTGYSERPVGHKRLGDATAERTRATLPVRATDARHSGHKQVKVAHGTRSRRLLNRCLSGLGRTGQCLAAYLEYACTIFLPLVRVNAPARLAAASRTGRDLSVPREHRNGGIYLATRKWNGKDKQCSIADDVHRPTRLPRPISINIFKWQSLGYTANNLIWLSDALTARRVHLRSGIWLSALTAGEIAGRSPHCPQREHHCLRDACCRGTSPGRRRGSSQSFPGLPGLPGTRVSPALASKCSWRTGRGPAHPWKDRNPTFPNRGWTTPSPPYDHQLTWTAPAEACTAAHSSCTHPAQQPPTAAQYT